MSSSSCVDSKPLLADRYDIVDVLRDSHIVQVLTADDSNTGERVLLKLYQQQHQGAYRREAAVALALSHSNIIHCLETFYLSTGEACLVYEYLPLGTLDHFMSNRLISREELLCLLADVFSGLVFLHESGFVHCDLKPDNILIRFDSTSNRIQAVIADLGAATPIKEARSGKHKTGSPAYTAPERLYEGFSLNSDLYSVGVIAFQLYTGQLPFMGSVQDIYRAHLTQAPALSEIHDVKIRHLIAMLLEKKPQHRIASASQALDIIQSMLLIHTPSQCEARSDETAVIATDHPIAIKKVYSSHLEHEADQLIVFGCAPYIGVARGHAMQILDITGHLQGPIQLSNGTFWPQTDGSIIFPTGNSLQRYYPNSLTYNLDIIAKDIKALRIQEQYIAFMDGRQLFIYHCDGQLSATVSMRHYALEPVLCEHPQGGFLASTGMANHELHWMGIDGSCLNTWNLGGPILAVTSKDDSILVACVALDEPSIIQFWVLSDNTKTGFRESVNNGSILSANGYFMWLRHNGDMVAMNATMTPQIIGHLPTDARLKSVSTCLDFFVVTYPQTARHYEIWRLESAGEQK